MKCPSFETILEHCDSGKGLPALEAHLREPCHVCARNVEWARELLGLLSEARLEEVPDRLRRIALRIPSVLGSAGSGKGKVARRWSRFVARLVPRREAAGLVPAFRGGAAGKHLLYRAEDHVVDIALLPGGSLVGQVLAESEGAPEFAGGYGLLSGEGRTVTCDLSEEGEFRFSSVTAGRYGLLLRSGEWSLVLDEIDLEREQGA